MVKKQTNKNIDLQRKDMNTSKKVVLTLFLLLLPVLIISFTQELMTKGLLFFYEAVLLRNFIIDKMKPEGY